jgi:hypothetical protein
MFPIQDVGAIPWSLAERAYQRYSQLYGTDQSLERLAERGGFGLAELGYLLRGHGRNLLSDEDAEWKRVCEYATREILNALRGSEARECADKLEAFIADAAFPVGSSHPGRLRALVVEWRGAQVTDITDADGQEAERE